MAVQFAPMNFDWTSILGQGLGDVAGKVTNALTNPYWGFMRNKLSDPYQYITEFGMAQNTPRSIMDSYDIYAGDANHPNDYRAVPKGQKPPPGYETPINIPGWNASRQWPNAPKKAATPDTYKLDWSNVPNMGFENGGVVTQTPETELLRKFLGISANATDRVPILTEPGETVIPADKSAIFNSILKKNGYPGGIEQFVKGMPRAQDGWTGVDYANQVGQTPKRQNNTPPIVQQERPQVPGIDTVFKVNNDLDVKTYRGYLEDIQKKYPGLYTKEIKDILSTFDMLQSGQKMDMSKVKLPAGLIIDNAIVFGQGNKGNPPPRPTDNSGIKKLAPLKVIPGSPEVPEQFGYVPEGQQLNFNQAAFNAAGGDPAKIMQLFLNESQRYGKPRQMPVTPEGTIDPNWKSPTDQKLEQAGNLMNLMSGAQKLGATKEQDPLAKQHTLAQIGLLNAQAAHYRTLANSPQGLTPKDQIEFIRTSSEIQKLNQGMYMDALKQAGADMEKFQKQSTGKDAGGVVSGNNAMKKTYAMSAIKFAFLSNPSFLASGTDPVAIVKSLPYLNTIKDLLTPAEIAQIANDVNTQLSMWGMSPGLTQATAPTTQGQGVQPTGTPKVDLKNFDSMMEN